MLKERKLEIRRSGEGRTSSVQRLTSKDAPQLLEALILGACARPHKLRVTDLETGEIVAEHVRGDDGEWRYWWQSS